MHTKLHTNGWAVVYEGANGCGKSSACHYARKRYGLPVVKESLQLKPPNPFNPTPYDERNHREYLTQILKHRKIFNQVNPEPPPGIYDRRHITTLVHQGEVATEEEIEWLIQDAKKYHFVILLESPYIAAERLLRRQDPRLSVEADYTSVAVELARQSRLFYWWGRILSDRGVWVALKDQDTISKL